LKSVHQAFQEHAEEEDREFLANLLDDAADSEDDEPDIGGDDEESEGAHALAAMGLGLLTNFV
jgi:hypothetical protein